MIELTREEARSLAVAAQGLAYPRTRPATKADVLETVGRLGCVQIDTIAVVARSHYLVLWSRLNQYDSAWLDELLYPDRQVFEYWAHAASMIPIELFPHFRHRTARYGHDDWSIENSHVLDHVRAAIRENGPLGSIHFDAPERDGPVQPWAWWGGKPTNRALDILWSMGELMVERRVNFQRIYDLTERVMPEWDGSQIPDRRETQRVLSLRAVSAMGITLPHWLNDYFRTKWGVRNHPGPTPASILEELADDGYLIRASVEDLGDGFVAAEHRDLLEGIRGGARPEHVTLLSPFDNLIWDRRRTLELFDFEYRIECYTPAPKRQYGYFTLPILYRGRLIGRLDPKVDRRQGHMVIKAIHLEPGVDVDDELIDALRDVLRRFANFHDATTIEVGNAPPVLISALRDI